MPLQKVNRFIQRHAMLEGAQGILVAVSGGPDSVALLDMLVRISLGDRGGGIGVRDPEPRPSNTQPPTPNPRLHIAHLDHMLRGGESSEDAEFVRALAGRLGLQVTIRAADVRAAATRSARGIEEVAREIRYDFLLAVANEAGCDRIAVGHTMTDQAETFLMRLIRGAGLRGLAAMRPISAVPIFRRENAEGRRQKAENESLPSAFRLLPPVSLIRPLLCLTREEVESYCRDRGLEFRTDSTNVSLQYTRNRLREGVLPALKSINPRVVESISRAADNIGADQDVLDVLALSLLSHARVGTDAGRNIFDENVAAYSVQALLKQSVGMRRRMIVEAIRLTRAGATFEERNSACEITSAHIASIEGLLAANASGKRIGLPCSVEVWREFDTLVIKPNEIKDSSYKLAIGADCPDVEAAGFAFTLQRDAPIELLKSVIEETRQEKQLTGRDWMTAAFDDHALPAHLVIRPRLRGERAQVIGHRRTIKLKNLMIDHRIPSSRRVYWPIVTTPDGEYVWSPGLPPSSKFVAHDETRILAIMRASAS